MEMWLGPLMFNFLLYVSISFLVKGFSGWAISYSYVQITYLLRYYFRIFYISFVFRNHILGLWNKDVTCILPLSSCGISATPMVDEPPEASLIREIYAFLDQFVSLLVCCLLPPFYRKEWHHCKMIFFKELFMYMNWSNNDGEGKKCLEIIQQLGAISIYRNIFYKKWYSLLVFYMNFSLLYEFFFAFI